VDGSVAALLRNIPSLARKRNNATRNKTRNKTQSHLKGGQNRKKWGHSEHGFGSELPVYIVSRCSL
jgi:hypothetical protein